MQYSASMTENAIVPATAPLRTRLAAMIYEALLVVAVVFIASILFIKLVGDTSVAWRKLAFQIYLVGVLYAYFAAFWLKSGQTLAMKTWRIRLVDLNGHLIHAGQAAIRFFLALIGLALFGITILWALFDPDRQFLHDRLARTRLVRVSP